MLHLLFDYNYIHTVTIQTFSFPHIAGSEKCGCFFSFFFFFFFFFFLGGGGGATGEITEKQSMNKTLLYS